MRCTRSFYLLSISYSFPSTVVHNNLFSLSGTNNRITSGSKHERTEDRWRTVCCHNFVAGWWNELVWTIVQQCTSLLTCSVLDIPRQRRQTGLYLFLSFKLMSPFLYSVQLLLSVVLYNILSFKGEFSHNTTKTYATRCSRIFSISCHSGDQRLGKIFVRNTVLHYVLRSFCEFFCRKNTREKG